MMTILRTKLTPPQLGKLWGISPDKIVAFIRSGELRAIVPPLAKVKRRRRRRDPAVREYF